MAISTAMGPWSYKHTKVIRTGYFKNNQKSIPAAESRISIKIAQDVFREHN